MYGSFQWGLCNSDIDNMYNVCSVYFLNSCYITNSQFALLPTPRCGDLRYLRSGALARIASTQRGAVLASRLRRPSQLVPSRPAVHRRIDLSRSQVSLEFSIIRRMSPHVSP